MERNLLFCFSGTGNSLKAAKDTASVLGDTEIVLMKGGYNFSGHYDRIGFLFPSYAGGVPQAALAYIKSLDIRADMAGYFFAVVTCGGAARNSLPMLRNALSKKGISLHYGKELNTVGNYIAMYPPKTDVPDTLRAADAQMALFAQEIKGNAMTSIGKSRFNATLFYRMGNLFFKLNAKKLNVSDQCASCGMCEKLCPTKSIRIQNSRPVFTPKTCSQCMACIQWCPKEAINCGTKTIERARYHHPEIKTDEFI